jgi:hypothetical protein
MFRHLLTAVVLVALFLPAMALADQITQFSEVSGEPAFTITDNVTFETLTASTSVYLTFDENVIPFGRTPQTATLTWSGTTSSYAHLAFGQWIEEGFSGWFSIMAGTDNLFSGTFSNATLVASGQTANFSETDTPPVITYTSNYLNFSNANVFALALSMTLSSSVSQDTNFRFLNFNHAAATGTFWTDPPPTIVPEPVTLLLSGGALLGLGLLRRKRKS